jgi:predicted  nucleic acid-binding Zn-ribbon protein
MNDKGYVITKNPLFRKKELEERIKGFDVSIARLERDISDIHDIIKAGTNKAENRASRQEQLNKMERDLRLYTNARDRDLDELTRLLQIKGGSRRSRRTSRRPNKTRKMRKS